MDSGYYAACTALKTQSQALELAANNIANVNTSGYRGQIPSFQSLLMAGSDGQPVSGIDDLHRLLATDRIGVRTTVVVLREAAKLDLEIVPEESKS